MYNVILKYVDCASKLQIHRISRILYIHILEYEESYILKHIPWCIYISFYLFNTGKENSSLSGVDAKWNKKEEIYMRTRTWIWLC